MNKGSSWGSLGGMIYGFYRTIVIDKKLSFSYLRDINFFNVHKGYKIFFCSKPVAQTREQCSMLPGIKKAFLLFQDSPLEMHSCC